MSDDYNDMPTNDSPPPEPPWVGAAAIVGPPDQRVKLEPLSDWVVCREVGPESLPGSRIIVPEKSRDFIARSVVIAVGPGHWEGGVFVSTRLRPGDSVKRDPHAKCMVNNQYGENLYMMRERDLILRVIEVEKTGPKLVVA